MEINENRLITDFISMVSIDSPSFGERRMGDHLTARLSSLGLSVREDDAGTRIGGNCGNILAFLDGNIRAEPLLFCSHMDTVEPSKAKRAAVDENGVIRSGGDTVLGADDVGGIAAILEALTVIQEQKLEHRPLEVLFTVAEEAYCRGAEQLDISGIRSGEAYTLDLSGQIGTAAFQAPTVLSYTATIRGKPAHAGFAPQDGIHAIAVAAEAIGALPMGQIDGETTMNVGVISGGRATNIVPDVCEIRGEVRSFSHERALEQYEAVRKQYLLAAEKAGASVDFELTTGCVAFQTPPAHGVVKRLERTCEALHLPFSLVRTFGGSDNSVLARHGIAGLVLASGMNEVHSPAEYTTVEELGRIALLTLALMTDVS